MSDLRKQLRAARDIYRSQRYPGDLAAELLPGATSRRNTLLKIFASATAVSGIAAAVLLWIGSRPVTPVAPPSPIISMIEDDGEAVAPVTALASVPEFPADMPMAPSLHASDAPMAPSFDESIEIGSIPSMPSLDMSFSETEPVVPKTSKEST